MSHNDNNPPHKAENATVPEAAPALDNPLIEPEVAAPALPLADETFEVTDFPPVETAETVAAQPAPAVEEPQAKPEVQADQHDEERRSLPERPPSTTVMQEYDIYVPLGEGKEWNDNEPILALPAERRSVLNDVIQEAPNIELAETEEGAAWATVFDRSQYTASAADYFEPTVDRENSAWRQGVMGEKGRLQAATPQFKDTEGQRLTGEMAVLRIKALTGQGSLVNIPLWHSGFWLTLKSPPESMMLELNRKIMEEKISLGRRTYGLAFSNQSVFFASAITDFVLNHVYSTSLKDRGNLAEKISSLDIPLLVWGIACCIWPRGFQYARSVVDDVANNNKVIREKLNVAKLCWVDTASLDKWQVAHMSKRADNSMTADDVANYKSRFVRGQERVVTLSEHIKATLSVPSLAHYVISGQRWVDNVVAMVDRAFGMPPDADVRNAYITAQGKATNLRQYSHWTSKLLTSSNQYVDDTDTMDNTFDVLSADDELSKKYFAEVKKFMEDSTIAIIATPIVANSEKEKTLPYFPHLLPLDALSTFFILLVQKVRQIQER